MKKEKIKTLVITKLITVLLFVGLILIYKYISDNKLFNPLMFPPLDKVVSRFFSDMFVGTGNYVSKFEHMKASFSLLIPSVIIMSVIALVVGTLVGRNEIARNILNPVLYAFSCVPAILMIPFLMVLVKNDTLASMVMIIYHIVWATLFSTIVGVQSVDKKYIESAETLKLSGPKMYFKVIFPAASPAILGGFVNSLRASFVMLVFAEMYNGGKGMGQYTRLNQINANYDKMWGGFVFMVTTLIIVMAVFERIKNYILRWTIDE